MQPLLQPVARARQGDKLADAVGALGCRNMRVGRRRSAPLQARHEQRWALILVVIRS